MLFSQQHSVSYLHINSQETFTCGNFPELAQVSVHWSLKVVQLKVFRDEYETVISQNFPLNLRG